MFTFIVCTDIAYFLCQPQGTTARVTIVPSPLFFKELPRGSVNDDANSTTGNKIKTIKYYYFLQMNLNFVSLYMYYFI
jgi:hypothetical protein